MAGRPPHPQARQRRTVARHLRRQGWTYAAIADALGVAAMTAWQLVHDNGRDDPAPDTVRGRNGGAYPARHRPEPTPPALDACPYCTPHDDNHDDGCIVTNLPTNPPATRRRNRGGPGNGRTPPNLWPVIVAKVAGGATHREVASAFGVSRSRVTAIVAKARAETAHAPQSPHDDEAAQIRQGAP